MKKTWLSTVWTLLLVLALLSTGNDAAFAAAPSGSIYGLVAAPEGGLPPAGTLVRAFDPGTENVRAWALVQPNGSFLLPILPNGVYAIRAVPPAESLLTQSLTVPVSVMNSAVNAGTLSLTHPQITGRVLAADGATLTPAWIWVHSADGTPRQRIEAPTGEYRIGGLPAGDFALVAHPAVAQPLWKSARTAATIVPGGAPQSLDLLLRPAQVWGTVTDPAGKPVKDATVIAARLDGTGANATQTLPGGYYAIGELKDGKTYQLSLVPPAAHHDLIAPDPLSITLPVSNPLDLQFNASPKTVSGVVRTNTSLPVQGAEVTARRADRIGEATALTGADGRYALTLTPGLWYLSVRGAEAAAPSNWVYPYPPQLVVFAHNTLPETRSEDFTVLTADATVSGQLAMPDGSAPTFPITVHLRSSEGVGRSLEVSSPHGKFTLQVPNGAYKVSVEPSDSNYLGPVLEPVSVGPDGSADLGIITLLARDAQISGTVSAGGSGVAGISVVAWQTGNPVALKSTTGEDGSYRLWVTAGDWLVRPAPKADQPYLFLGDAQAASLPAAGTQTGVNFDLASADATLTGTLVDETGAVVTDASGWVSAVSTTGNSIRNGAPVEGGLFTLYLPAGTYTLTLRMPNGSPYLSNHSGSTILTPGANTLTIQVTRKISVITGALWDPRNKEVVSGVKGMASARQADDFALSPIDPRNGTYRLEVGEGLWNLNYRIDPLSGYVKEFGARMVPVPAGKTIAVPLQVLKKDALVSGTVQAPDGSPLAGAVVVAHGVSLGVMDLDLKTLSGEDGSFQIALPYGAYRLGAEKPGTEWIQPAEKPVEVAAGATSGGHVLLFRESDATLGGTITLQGGTALDGAVWVFAYSPDGALSHGRFEMSAGSAAYSLPVVAGMKWTVGAAFETSDSWWSARQPVTVDSTAVTLDLVLDGPKPKPAPVSVTFDPAEAVQVSLADGTTVFIPAGAIPAEGPLTLRVTPIVHRPGHYGADVLKLGYAFLLNGADGQPVEDTFLQDVILTFFYSDAELARQGTNEHFIKPAYFSTTENRWSAPDSFSIDYDANRVSLAIDHFTDFALTGMGTVPVFIPIMAR